MKTFVLSLIIITLFSCSGISDGVEHHQLATAVQTAKEYSRPERYLLINSTWKENLVGRKVFSGSVLNQAKLTTFDELLLTFHFFDSLNVKVGERSFFAKEVLTPGKVYKFKIKTFAPVPTKSYTCTVKAKERRW
ncbi:MAG: hypothetical protein M0D57_10920 [Sphingobacteriales bacterium JAD_PAG50586_3]|nr:MAG: hypothetical protein M0D57_10920 [Sphingobacteriales bacterium JAD_PAG50586_3]